MADVDSYVGEIRMFGGNYAPDGWALCDGTLLQVANNEALFSLLGTTYGGDGRSTFGLPDLRGRLPVGQGQGPGLSNRVLAQAIGAETVALAAAEVAPHTHPVGAGTAATALTPANNFPGQLAATVGNLYYKMPVPPPSPAPTKGVMAASAVSTSGASAAHNNVMPATGVTFIICTVGLYPSAA